MILRLNNKSFLLLLFAFSIAYFLPIIKLEVGPLDEGVVLTGAERVLKGQFPYRDFFTPYAPGQFYVLSGLFKIFGISVDVGRIYDLVIRSLIPITMFLIIRKLVSPKAALVGWIMSIVWLGYNGFMTIPTYPSILFIYISIYFFILHLDTKENTWIVLCALSSLIAFLFRHDFAGFFAIVVIAVLFVRKYVSPTGSLRPLMYYVISGLAALLPVCMYLLLNMDAEYLVEDLILFGIDVYPKNRWTPYPSLSFVTLPFFVFPVIPFMGFFMSLIILKKQRHEKTDSITGYAVLLISLLGIVFLNQIRTRPDMTHIIPVALTGILLSPIMFHVWLRQNILQKMQIKKIISVLFVVSISVVLIKPVEKKTRLFFKDYTMPARIHDVQRAGHSYVPEELADTVKYIKRSTSIDDYIYVGVTNHDKFVLNDAIIYFLASRNIPTRSHELHPGISNISEGQNEIVDELKRTSTELIVLAPRSWNEKNLSSIDMNLNIVDNYISSDFELVKKYGTYEIWRKKESIPAQGVRKDD